MIDKDEILNFEQNKEDPHWMAVFEELKRSRDRYRIRNLIVHPDATVLCGYLQYDEVRPTRSLVIDLDTLELVGGAFDLSHYTNNRIRGGHLVVDYKDNRCTFSCKSVASVISDQFILKKNSRCSFFENTLGYRTYCEVGENSSLDIVGRLFVEYYSRAPTIFKIGNNSQVVFDLDTCQEFHIEIGNNCKVLHTDTRNCLYGDSAVVQKKKLKYRRPIKIKDNTTCLLVN